MRRLVASEPLPLTVAYGNTKPGDEPARWISIGSDGAVVAYAGKVEYGQGVRGGFAIEVADELRLSPKNVWMVLGDTDEVPRNIVPLVASSCTSSRITLANSTNAIASEFVSEGY